MNYLSASGMPQNGFGKNSISENGLRAKNSAAELQIANGHLFALQVASIAAQSGLDGRKLFPANHDFCDVTKMEHIGTAQAKIN